MPEEEKAISPDMPDLQFIPASGFPPEGIPTVFIDGIVNLLPAANVVRFYLFRTDPEIRETKPKQRNAIVAQVIMPTEAFVASVAFLHASLDRLVAQGVVRKEYVDSAYSQMSAHINK